SQACQTTTASEYRIVHGLDLLQTLLESEVEEPKVWEEAYSFVMRVQWTFSKLDGNIKSMFSRYLYLEAKKIIYTHGWTSDEQITNCQSNRNGLIRTVAIRLMSFSVFGSANEDVRNLIVEGFLQLGFRGLEQYPHCGVMWSVITN
ncbi:hypothetical protein PMAYCL1PPCAC_04245, partial [Pristionchus mayeri]